MPASPTRVDILIATYRRPEQLRALLESLARMPLGEDLAVRVVVVDNDPEGSARAVAEDFAAREALPLVYALEPEKGVSQARNRALSLADAEYLAFVDDDETVDPGWLEALLAAGRRHFADVVFGPVPSRLPESAPAWLRASRLFDRPRMATGTPRVTGGAGNVLLRAEVVRRAGRGFDPAFGLSGGEDTEYFRRLHAQGARLVWCDEAVAWEAVPEERANFKWLWRRNLNAGRLYNRVALPGMPLWRALCSTALTAAGVLVLAALAPASLLAGRHVAARLLMKLARGLGRLSALPEALRASGAAA